MCFVMFMLPHRTLGPRLERSLPPNERPPIAKDCGLSFLAQAFEAGLVKAVIRGDLGTLDSVEQRVTLPGRVPVYEQLTEERRAIDLLLFSRG